MKHVEILNDRKQVIRRYADLLLTKESLERECAAFGPGKYYARWYVQKNVPGEKRQKIEQKKEVYIYDDPGEGSPTVVRAGAPGVTIYQQPARGPVTAETLREIFSEAIKPIAERVAVLETERAGLDEDEDEDEDEDQEIGIWQKVIEIARKPKYVPLIVPLLSAGTDDQKFQAIEAAFAADPTLKHEIFMDLLALLPQDIIGGAP